MTILTTIATTISIIASIIIVRTIDALLDRIDP